MKKKIKVIGAGIVCLAALCWLIWRFMPVCVLQKLDPKEVAAIEVLNRSNGNAFKITDPGEITFLVGGIQQITFREKTIAGNVPHWYVLNFLDENGRSLRSLFLQNHHNIRVELTENRAIFLACEEGLEKIADELERLEAARFPDSNRDPDFSGSGMRHKRK